MRFEEYVGYDGLGLAALVRAGEVTADELLGVALARVAATDEAVAAVVHVQEVVARNATAGGLPDGPFTGVPFLLKDLGGEAMDFPTSMGSRLYDGYRYEYDSELFVRLRATGLGTFARATSPEFGIGATTDGGSGAGVGRVASAVMPVMRRMTWARMSEAERTALCERGLTAIFDADLKVAIGRIIDDVRANGDEAVCRALRNFDKVTLEPHQLKATADELAAATVGADVDAAIDDAIEHLRAFNEQLIARADDWSFESEPGLTVGEKITPITSAGLFVPSGKASYPSVAYQLAVPATVAGVPTLALVVPPMPDGSGRIDPAVLVVCRKLGISEVFRVNGPAGVAALGFGTETIPKVRKIVGPGSPPVACAQVEMQRYGVATMMILGPTESMVIADDSADPRLVAADLLNEAEHGTDSAVVLVTPSATLAAAVELELESQLALLPATRAEAARAALGINGGCMFVDDLGEAAEVANRWAPEHLQVAVAADVEAELLDQLCNAGEILIGQHTLFSAGNFVIGCPASLPTGGFAHVSSGITADTFLKRTAVARADAVALQRMTPTILAMSAHEGFPAHANAAHQRVIS